ncbi:MAG: hypothetical protein ACK5NT_01750 [Pyrinomonadaceae bacterium]
MALMLLTAAPGVLAADYLTKGEIELIQFYQEVDARMEIYTTAIDRRLLVIDGTENLSEKARKRLEKQNEKYGELPEGDASKMVSDIENILDEAINKIDDAADRGTDTKEFKRAVHLLADYSKGLLLKLSQLENEAKFERDRSVISTAEDFCNQIIEAAKKIERISEKDMKKKRT